MRRVVVPGYDPVEDADTVLLEWELDGTGYRAQFAREADRLALNHVEQRARPPVVLDAGLEIVPRALLHALQRHGYDVVVPQADAEDDTEAAESAAVAEEVEDHE